MEHALGSNPRYICPLCRHIFSLAPVPPPMVLVFVGLPVLVANCPSDIAESLFVAHTPTPNSSVLPSREDMLADLSRRERTLQLEGLDP